MPAEPQPISLFEIAKRAVEICDPDDQDSRLGDLLEQFEDADTILYLAHRRDELHADPSKILRLAARAEWKGDLPLQVVDWLADRGVGV
jgi:hypothetical protein